MMDFKSQNVKIKKESAVDKLCNTMRECILNGTWRTNDKLPTEHELSEAFGLNRMTVRAALQRLNALGILETRTGDGTYVRSFNFIELISSVSDFFTSPELLKDVGKFRMIVEGGSAGLVIDNGTPEELEELRRISKELSAAYDIRASKNGDTTPEEFHHLYLMVFLFHEQLFKMMHNKLLYYAHAVARDAVCKALTISGERRAKHYYGIGKGEKLKFHEKIVEAIEARDHEACQVALTKYVSPEVDYW